MIIYNDKTTVQDCGAWEIVAEGTLSIDGTFNGTPDCQLWVTITETWKQPSVVSTSCSGIEPAPLTSPVVNPLIEINYVKNAEVKPVFTQTDTTVREDVFILRDPEAHETTGCEIIFEATPVPVP